MPHHISDRLLSLLSEYITRWLGLHFPQKRWRDLERIIRHAALELECGDITACIEQLVSDQLTGEQKEILAGHLTIGETYFFREQKSLDILENHILPGLISSRRGKEQRLRIWSAGCSTGEEPYSLAILLSRLIPDCSKWQINILATDINGRSLGKAQKGIYSEWSFRGVPDWVRQRYFTQTQDGRFEIRNPIRGMVNFALLNLAEDIYPALSTNTNAMDIILCRNVLMYFEPKQQHRVIEGFHRSLLTDGWLVVSPCETSPAFSTCFQTVMFPGAVFYKKTDRTEKTHCMGFPVPAATPDPLASTTGQPGSRLYVPLPPGAPPRQPDPGNVPQPSPPAGSLPYDEALELYRQGCYGEAADRLSGMLGDTEATAESAHLFGKAASLLTQSLANRGEIASALEWADKAIAVDKLNAELYYLRAAIQQEKGTAEQAVASLKQALYIDHSFVPAHFALGTLTLQQGKPREAGRHLENALSLLGSYHPDDPVPGTEGMTAARLTEIIGKTRASILQQ